MGPGNSFSYSARIGQMGVMFMPSPPRDQSLKAMKSRVFDRLLFCAKTVVHAVHVFSSCDEPMLKEGAAL